MMMKSTRDNPILVTGAAGAIGAIGRNLAAMLLAKGHKVRALVRREDERADALRRLGAEVVQGDLTDLASLIAPSKAARASISACRSRRSIWRPRSTPPGWRAITASRPS
jgi:nucleoside-diphosphate-sugar epimerase